MLALLLFGRRADLGGDYVPAVCQFILSRVGARRLARR
jgi:hypothetical protein